MQVCRFELRKLLGAEEIQKIKELQALLDSVKVFEDQESKPKSELSAEEIL